MNAQNVLRAFLAAAVVLPISGDSAAFPHALARRGCTQEDAPALEVLLTRTPYDGKDEPPKPYLHIEIEWGDFSRLAGKELELIPLSRHGVDPKKLIVRAGLVADGAPVWLSGTLCLKRVEIDKQVEGSYRFAAPDKSVWVGKFKSPWVAGRHTCG
jgi:hypothetical protein